MEPNENNLKPQPTGGLKLMTVFIAVLALHVVVIGGFTVWHLLYPSGTDADLTVDKTHKAKIVADNSIGDMPGDTSATDKAVTPATASGTTPDSSAATTSGDGTSTTASPAAADASSAASDTAAAGTTASSESTTPAPATPAAASTPMPPAMAEDASSAAANPPAVAPAPVAATTPAGTHPAAVTLATTPDLAPPADASSIASGDSTAAAPAVAAGTSYTVKRGDSLARIARRHHITLAALRSANNLKSDRLHIAQVLVLPGKAPKAAAPADADAEALATPAPATTASGPVADSDATDSASTTAPSAVHTVASTRTPHHAHKMAVATHHLYTVVKGDTLTKIAKRYHTSTSAIVAANGLTNAGRLSIGQKLHIPSHEARTAEDKPILAEPHGATRAQLANNLPSY